MRSVKMEQHIELYEKYVKNSIEEIEYYEEDLGIPLKLTYGYRRIYPLLETIKYPREIVDNNEEFIIVFHGDYEIICKGNYDEFCITLNDLRNNMNED